MKVLDILKNRFSPYEYSSQALTEEELMVLFEAAGKAASAFNEQPWRFIYALKDDTEHFNRLHSCLLEGNQGWSKDAPALVFTAVRKTYARNGNPNRVAEHDLGLAMGNLTAQAMSMGIYLHQMAGIDQAKAKQELNVPEEFEVITAFGIGHYEGEADIKPKKALNEIAFKGTM